MTAYAVGIPRAAAERGGDCLVADLAQGRWVGGVHRFAAPEDCWLNNGLLRVGVGVAGAVPTLTLTAQTGLQVIDDFYTDVYTDLYEGSYSPKAWTPKGDVVIDSSVLSAVLTGVVLECKTPEVVTIRLVSPVIADAFASLRRGESFVRIQHGSTRSPLVTTTRRVRIVAAGVTAAALPGRAEETAPLTGGFARFVAAREAGTSNAGAFSVTSPAVTMARFEAGVGWGEYGSRPADLHGQLSDTSRKGLVIT